MEALLGPWDATTAAIALALAAATILGLGPRLAHVVERLADLTGLGEALAGAVLLAAATSLPGLVTTGVAAAAGEASLAVSNSIGGIAAQTAFVVAGDLALRRVNLEHAAASLPNIFSAQLLVTLLAAVLLASAVPGVSWFGVHPVSVVIPAVYLYGLHVTRTIGEQPMWRPIVTPETTDEEPDDETQLAAGTRELWTKFAVLAVVMAAAGYVVGRGGVTLIAEAGLSGTFVGAAMTSIATSLPELVTTVAAVRAGAVTLAVAGLIGGNTFDVLMVPMADVIFRDGPVYAALLTSDRALIAWAIVLTTVLAAGLVRRQKAGIGFEGAAIIVLYLGGLVVFSQL